MVAIIWDTFRGPKSIQDLPFEGPSLISEKMDDRLHSLKGSRATLKSIGIYTLAAKRKQFHPQQPYKHQGFTPLCQIHWGKRAEVIGDTLHCLCLQHQWAHPIQLPHPNRHFYGLVRDSVPVTIAPSVPHCLFTNCLSQFLSAWAHIRLVGLKPGGTGICHPVQFYLVPLLVPLQWPLISLPFFRMPTLFFRQEP